MKRLLYSILFLVILPSCSDRLKNDLNPYGRALEEYPEKIIIPAEGGSYEMVFESNFRIKNYLHGDFYGAPYSHEIVTTPIVDERYYKKVSIRIIAESNSTGAERTDTLCVYYRHPAVILPIDMKTTIGRYCLIQPSLH